jgi:hypothetical protein
VGERATLAWVLAALLGASLEPILVKLGYRAEATPWQLLALKNLVAAAVIVPLARAPKWPGLPGVLRIGRVSVLLIVTNALSLLALTRLPAVTLMTVVATTPAAVALVARARGRVRPGARFWAALVAALVGMALTLDVVRPGALALDAVGLALAFGAVASSTLYRSAMEDITATFGPKVVSTWVFLVNAAVTSALVLPWSRAAPSRGAPDGPLDRPRRGGRQRGLPRGAAPHRRQPDLRLHPASAPIRDGGRGGGAVRTPALVAGPRCRDGARERARRAARGP